MRGVRSLIAGVTVAAVLITGAAFAQGRRGGGFARDGGGPGGPGIALRALDLTEAQREQVRGIQERHRDELRQVEERVRAALVAQRNAIETVPVDEALIRSASQSVADAQTDAAIQRARLYSDVWGVLTPAQQEQARKLRAERENRQQQRRENLQQRRQNRG